MHAEKGHFEAEVGTLRSAQTKEPALSSTAFSLPKQKLEEESLPHDPLRAEWLSIVSQRPLSWEPLSDRFPSRQTSQKAIHRALRFEQQRYLRAVELLVAMQRPETWEEALSLLRAIPAEQRRRFRMLFSTELDLLRLLGRTKERDQAILEAFSVEMDPLFWMEFGLGLVAWLQEFEHADATRKAWWEKACVRLYQQCSSNPTPILRVLLLGSSLADASTKKALEDAGMQCDQMLAEMWDASAWQTQHPQFPLWLGGLVELTQRVVALPAFVESWSRRIDISPFAWKLLPVGGVPQLHGLFWLISQQGDEEAILSVCRELLTSHPQSVSLHYWRGHLRKNRGPRTLVEESFRVVLCKPADLPHPLVLEAALWWLQESQPPEDIWERLLILEKQVSQDNSLESLLLRFGCSLRRGQHDDASQVIEQILEAYGEQPLARQYAYENLVFMGRFDDIEPILLRLWETSQEDRALAGTLLTVGWVDRGEEQRACTLFSLESEAHAAREALSLQESELVLRFSLAWGHAQCCEGDADDGLAWLEGAYQAHPEEQTAFFLARALFLRLVGLPSSEEPSHAELCLRFEALVQEVRQKDLSSFFLESLWCRYLLSQERWEPLQAAMHQLGIKSFQEEGDTILGILLWVSAQVGCGAWEAAARCFQQHLSVVLQDELLRELFLSFFGDFVDVYAAQQQMLAKQEILLEQRAKQDAAAAMLQQEQQRLQSSLKRLWREKGALQQALVQQKHHASKQKRVESSPSSLGYEKHLVEFKKKYDLILKDIPFDYREVLLLAERLWWQFALSPHDDHAPIVVQYCRVMEWACNRCWVDRLVGFAMEEGVRLVELPPCGGRLLASRNRLSLGDVVRLFFDRATRTCEGEIEMIENPHANETLRQLLETFWSRQKARTTPPRSFEEACRYLRTEGVFALQGLTRLRNRASHAGAKIRREETAELRRWIFGGETEGGLLGALLWLERIEVKAS